MSEYVIMPKADYTAACNAIRTKTGKADLIKSGDMEGEILGITSGGGSSADVRYVTFMNEDGSVELGKKAVAVGDDCADPIARGVFSTPTKESTAQYTYTLYGWATTPNGAADSNWNKAVTEDRTVYANFVSAVRYYTITYYDSDGTTVLKTESLAYGSIPSYTPTKNGYTFKGWTTEIVEVTGDASYIATWAAQEKLEDYTWAQLNAMSIAELKAKFKIGDCKDKYALVGFEQDTTSSGEKVKMTFISGNLLKSMELNTYSDTYTDMAHYTNIRDNPSTYIPDYSAEIASVAKSVKKKYLSSRTNGSIVEVSQKFWVPSASEFGYIPDGTTVLDEGNAYSAFNKVSFGSNISATYTTTLYSNFALGKRALRTRNPAGCLYLNSGKATQLNGNASNIARASSVYFTVGFCI